MHFSSDFAQQFLLFHQNSTEALLQIPVAHPVTKFRYAVPDPVIIAMFTIKIFYNHYALTVYHLLNKETVEIVPTHSSFREIGSFVFIKNQSSVSKRW